MINKNTKEYIKLRRDYAAKAMQGLISNIDSLNGYFNESNITTREEMASKITEISFDFADAMIQYENNEND